MNNSIAINDDFSWTVVNIIQSLIIFTKTKCSLFDFYDFLWVTIFNRTKKHIMFIHKKFVLVSGLFDITTAMSV